MPETWLNQARWLDDDPAAQVAPDNRPWWQIPERAQLARNDQPTLGTLIAKHANGIWPITTLGPPHGQPGSLVSDALARDLGLVGTYDRNGMLVPGKKPKFSPHAS